MKYTSLLIPIGFSLALTGCVHSHMHGEAAYDTTAPAYGTAATPTSSRSAIRVYSETPAPIVAPDGNAVTTTPTPQMDDMDHAVAIRNMLQNDKAMRIAAKNVDIEVKNGAAILRGTVRNETERQLLEQRVSATPGITSMQNRLIIAP